MSVHPCDPIFQRFFRPFWVAVFGLSGGICGSVRRFGRQRGRLGPRLSACGRCRWGGVESRCAGSALVMRIVNIVFVLERTSCRLKNVGAPKMAKFCNITAPQCRRVRVLHSSISEYQHMYVLLRLRCTTAVAADSFAGYVVWCLFLPGPLVMVKIVRHDHLAGTDCRGIHG